jgi:hypothetical protein
LHSAHSISPNRVESIALLKTVLGLLCDSATENLMPTLTGRQIGFRGKGAGKVTDKPKNAPPFRP